MQNLHGILAFVESARAGSLSGAARKLDLSPAAVSKNVIRLEEELGVRLFNRSTRRLNLTAEGESFFHHSEAILRQLDMAIGEISATKEEPTGKVRITVGVSFGMRWVIPLMPELVKRYPRLQPELDLENRAVDLVKDGFDIGIRGGVIRDSSLVARRICALPLIVVASPLYLDRKGVPDEPESLEQHECIGIRFHQNQSPAWRFRRDGDILEITPVPRIIVNDPDAAIELAIRGAGLAQVGAYHALPHLREGRLKVLFLGVHDPGDLEIMIHYPHRRFLAPRVKATVEFLVKAFQVSKDLNFTMSDLRKFAVSSINLLSN